MEPLSAYEEQRLANIAANKEKMVALGLEEATAAMRPAQPKKRPMYSERAPPPKQSRGSKRLQGEAADDVDDVPAAVESMATRTDPLKRASRVPRLTAEQSARLDALEEVSAGPLNEDELQAVELAREHIDEAGGGWSDKRAALEEAATIFPLRWPTWLGKIEDALPKMGNTKTAQDNTMFGIMRAACGIGLEYHAWPERVGVLLANDEPTEGVTPRILTLGSDTEMLRREGQKLEAKFGRDAGNGWVYNHALGKLRHYQEKLLGPADQPSAPSIFDLENGGGDGEE